MHEPHHNSEDFSSSATGCAGVMDDTAPGGDNPLLAENQMLRMALDIMPHGLCMFDGADRLLLANRRFARLWDIPFELTRPGTSYATIQAAVKGFEKPHSLSQPNPPPGWSGVRRREWQMNDGRTIGVAVTRLPDASSVALHEDVTQARQDQEQITLLARNARGEEFAVLCLDLDRFKVVNDSFGHAVGDVLLGQVAQRLRACVRDAEFVARLGGGEFVVLQCGAPQPVGSTALARRIIAVLSEPFNLGGNTAQIGASIGIAIAPFDGENPQALLKSADLAMYRATKPTAAAFCATSSRKSMPEPRPAAHWKPTCTRRLAHDQFHLVYQPQLNISDRVVTGVEALLRWTNPCGATFRRLNSSRWPRKPA